VQQHFPRQSGHFIVNTFSTPSVTIKPAFAYQAGAGVQCRLSRAFFLLGNMDYLGASTKEEEFIFNGSTGFSP
jgi:hypothetical protein